MSPFAAQPVTNPQLSLILTPTGDAAPILCLVDGTVAAHVRWMRLRGFSPNTVKQREAVLTRLVTFIAGPLLGATPDQLDSWQGTLLGLALASRHAYVSNVCSFYAWAAEHQLLDADPSTVLVRPRVPPGLPRPISEQSLERALTQAPTQIRIWLELAGFEGARAAEIAAMERPDLLWDQPEPGLILRGKGGKTRVVPLAPAVESSLRATDLPARGPLWHTVTGRPVRPSYVSNTVNTWLHDNGIPETLHQLRHRFGTQALAVSGNLREVQDLMGHRSPATTAVYTLVNASKARSTVAAIDHPLLRPVQDTGS